ncbi:MAG: hypothetical protein ACREEP_14590, partial [Dongiaceae bacterium]
ALLSMMLRRVIFVLLWIEKPAQSTILSLGKKTVCDPSHRGDCERQPKIHAAEVTHSEGTKQSQAPNQKGP